MSSTGHVATPTAFHTTSGIWVETRGDQGQAVLLVAGLGDPLEGLGRQVADAVPGAEFVVLDGEAHQPFQESPDEFNGMVVRFWDAIDR